MNPILIIIRGNSGSGKTVLANLLHQHLGYNDCLLIHQDVIRRDILHVNDHPGTPAVDMIKSLIDYGFNNYPITILEGILRRDVYGDMLDLEVKKFGHGALVYYLDVPFSVTVLNDLKKGAPFGAKLLKKWWRDKDYLNQNDFVFSNGTTMDFYQKIIKDIQIKD